jgi:hypothetical protein
MDCRDKVRVFLQLSSSAGQPKSIRAISESIGITEEEVGLAVNYLRRHEKIIKIAQESNSEGLQYYI